MRFQLLQLERNNAYYKEKRKKRIRKNMTYEEIIFWFHTVINNVSHCLDLISLNFWCPHFFVSADITVGHRCPSLYIKRATVKQSHSHCQVYYKYLHTVMSETLRRSLSNYYNTELLIGQKAELIMQSALLSTTYAYDRQQVIYIVDKML